MTADEILGAARECLGTPFAHQGRIVGVALDCAGVICHVAKRLGLSYEAPSDYPRLPYEGLLEATLDQQPVLRRLLPGEPTTPGDVLLMRFAHDPQHLAILTDRGILHAWQSAGKCCEHDLDTYWAGRIVRAYRFREIDL